MSPFTITAFTIDSVSCSKPFFSGLVLSHGAQRSPSHEVTSNLFLPIGSCKETNRCPISSSFGPLWVSLFQIRYVCSRQSSWIACLGQVRSQSIDVPLKSCYNSCSKSLGRCHSFQERCVYHDLQMKMDMPHEKPEFDLKYTIQRMVHWPHPPNLTPTPELCLLGCFGHLPLQNDSLWEQIVFSGVLSGVKSNPFLPLSKCLSTKTLPF